MNLKTENKKLKDIIYRASVEFYRDNQTDGETAAEMQRILTEANCTIEDRANNVTKYTKKEPK